MGAKHVSSWMVRKPDPWHQIPDRELDTGVRNLRGLVARVRHLDERDPDFLDREHEVREECKAILDRLFINNDPVHHAECFKVGKWIEEFYLLAFSEYRRRGGR